MTFSLCQQPSMFPSPHHKESRGNSIQMEVITEGSLHTWQSWVEMPRASPGTHEQMYQRAKKKLGLITQIVFIKRLTAQGAHQTLYKGILLLQVEKYKIAPKAIQYICGYLDTTHAQQLPHTLYSPINTKLGGKGLDNLTCYHVKNVSYFKKSDLI